MCKAVREGGQRCAAHTRGAAIVALEALGCATTTSPVSDEQLEDLAAYASTPSGRAELSRALARLEILANPSLVDIERMSILGSALKSGDKIREANAEAARQMAAKLKDALIRQEAPVTPFNTGERLTRQQIDSELERAKKDPAYRMHPDAAKELSTLHSDVLAYRIRSRISHMYNTDDAILARNVDLLTRFIERENHFNREPDRDLMTAGEVITSAAQRAMDTLDDQERQLIREWGPLASNPVAVARPVALVREHVQRSLTETVCHLHEVIDERRRSWAK